MAVLLLGVPDAASLRPAAAGDEEVREVGQLPRFPADAVASFGRRILPEGADIRQFFGGTLIGIPEAGQLWQVFPTSSNNTGSPTAIAVRDIATLRLARTLELPVPLRRAANSAGGGDWLHALDGGRRVFLVSIENRSRATTPTVIEVDLATLAVREFALGPPVATDAVANLALPIAAIEYDPYSDALLMLASGFPSSSLAHMGTVVHRLDLRNGTQTTRHIRTCNGGLPPNEFGETSQVQGIVTESHVFFACQRSGNIGAVVKIERASLMDPTSTEENVAGPAYLESSFADRAGGRLFLVTLSAEIWAYDIATSSFVGVVAAKSADKFAPDTGIGLDRSSGRLFFQSGDIGLGIAEGRFRPIPQARVFRTYAAPGQERIISDGARGRIFVVPGTSQFRASAYRIIHVGTAPGTPPSPDPDRNTADVDEQPGVTDVRYFGSGTGFGVRTLLAKGVSAVPPAPALGQLSPTGDALVNNINSKCGFTDRELVVGRVAKAEYDTGSTAAQAVGIDVDERTKLDLANPSRCDVAGRMGTASFEGIFSTDPFAGRLRENERGVAWDREPASCSSSEGGEHTADTSRNEGQSRAAVECPVPGGKLVAEASGYLTGPVAVGRVSTESQVLRDGRSIVSAVTAEAYEVDIAGVIRIGRITSTARSKANGRPQKEPMSTHQVSMQGVTIADAVVCTRNCNVDEVIRVLNLATAGRVEFRSKSGLDHRLLRGTPRGASTAVQKSEDRQASDQALVGDRTTEVAALEVVVYNDNPSFGRARQIYQFAGVSTAATYNVFRVPTGMGFDEHVSGSGSGGFDVAMLTPTGGDGLQLEMPTVEAVASLDDPSPASPSESSGDLAGFVGRAARAVARGLRLFLTDPRHTALLTTAWALFVLPAVLARRRRLLDTARVD